MCARIATRTPHAPRTHTHLTTAPSTPAPRIDSSRHCSHLRPVPPSPRAHSDWGERGWFRILRGSDHLFIESDCAWAVPDVSQLHDNLADHQVGDYVSGVQRAPAQADADGALLKRVRHSKAAAAAQSTAADMNFADLEQTASARAGSDVGSAPPPVESTHQTTAPAVAVRAGSSVGDDPSRAGSAVAGAATTTANGPSAGDGVAVSVALIALFAIVAVGLHLGSPGPWRCASSPTVSSSREEPLMESDEDNAPSPLLAWLSSGALRAHDRAQGYAQGPGPTWAAEYQRA